MHRLLVKLYKVSFSVLNGIICSLKERLELRSAGKIVLVNAIYILN